MDTDFNTQLKQINQTLTHIQILLSGVAILPVPTAGAVGSYVFASSTVAVAFGATTAGANLTPTNAGGGATGAALTGTWQCMGNVGVGGVTLFVRVS